MRLPYGPDTVMNGELRIMLVVASGSAVGGVARYLVSYLVPAGTFPWSTLTVNVTGCFLIGIGLALANEWGVSPTTWNFLASGFCGGYTTVSMFSFENVHFLIIGEPFIAIVYATISIALCMVGVVIGYRATIKIV